MHILALVAVCLAGAAFCAAGWMRWRSLREDAVDPHRWVWPVWLGLGLLTVALVATFIEGDHPSFRFGVLVSWAAIASIFFVGRFLTLPSPGLLVLPVGGMALLVGLTGIAESIAGPAKEAEPYSGMPMVLIVHIVFMTVHLAAMICAGGAGLVYLLTSRKLKTSVTAALKLPSLSSLEQLCERSLVVATALLIGGLVTGGAAMQLSDSFSLGSWPVISSMTSMAVLVVLLALRLARRLGRRHLALGSLLVLGLALFSVFSVFAGHYVD